MPGKVVSDMQKIASFTVDHRLIKEWIYISRVDGDITTYDIRMRKPNTGDVMSNALVHSFEHLFATFMRNGSLREDVVYVGPMGCQTGFYLLIRHADNSVVLSVVKDTLQKIINHDGEMFGAVRRECGNYKNLDLDAAKREAERYLAVLNSREQDFKYKGEKI